MILGVVQARTSSSRLPGKVLLPLLGQPMLARQIERLRRAERMDELVIATSDDPSDDDLAQLCDRLGVGCYRGDLDDVLDRFYQAARQHDPDHVVRLTGDCPLADPAVIDHVIAAHLDEGNDYTSNAIQRTYPDGLDVEVMRMACLAEAWREARLPSEREHVTPFLNQQPERFSMGHVRQAVDHSALRWTVDEPADFEFVQAIYQRLHPSDPCFDSEQILALLEREPALTAGNSHIPLNEGLTKSREADQRFLEEERRSDA